MADETCLDRVAEAFARVVDAKSPWTFQHSTRVAEIAVGVAQQFGCQPELERDIRRAALLHDIGKLGVSNLILDKPGKPTPEEFDEIRKHPDYTQQILERVGAFRKLADVASAHHERLDGRGYHRRMEGGELPWTARILTVADICEAMSAHRPYRDAMPWEQIHEIMSRDVGSGIDGECFSALVRWQERNQLDSRVEEQLSEVERLLAELSYERRNKSGCRMTK
jgi:putative nucleotidyltransferase with HDIG domain